MLDIARSPVDDNQMPCTVSDMENHKNPEKEPLLSTEHTNWCHIRVRERSCFFFFFFFFFFYLDGLGSLACSHSELTLKSRVLYIVGRTPWTADEPVTRTLPTKDTTNTEQT
jgi:hypothetical protein